LNEGLAAQDFHRLVVGDIAVAQDAVMAVRREGVERHVAEDAEIGKRCLDRPGRPAYQIFGIDGFVAPWRLSIERRHRKERDDGDTERPGFAGGVDKRRDRQSVDTRHRLDGRSRRRPIMHEDRPDEIGRRQHMLGDEPARPVIPPIAAQAKARIGAERGGGELGHGLPRRKSEAADDKDRAPARQPFGAPQAGASLRRLSAS
jgi:hypothetical protein